MMNIQPYEKNAKKHTRQQVELLAKVVREVGWRQPVIVNQQGVIVAGHGRWITYQAFKEELKEVWVMDDAGNTVMGGPETTPLTPDQEKMWRIADNQINAMTDLDMRIVIPELASLPANMIELTGFSRDIILSADDKDDHIPKLPSKENVRTTLGDLYELGGHKILCGDSTSATEIEKLMGGGTAKLIFTSPPYNMGASLYANYKDDLEREKYIDFNMSVIRAFMKHLKGFIFWNISYNKNTRDAFIEVMYKISREPGMSFMELIIWNKKHALPITSKDVLTRQYEDILLTGDPDSISSDMELFVVGKNERGSWFNKKTNKGITNYWEIGTNNTQTDNHGACFPVALPLKGITLMSGEGDIVVDPFMGTGSTLIAAEKSGRKCYGMELDPVYVDVVVARWVEYTGQRNIIKNGEPITW